MPNLLWDVCPDVHFTQPNPPPRPFSDKQGTLATPAIPEATCGVKGTGFIKLYHSKIGWVFTSWAPKTRLSKDGWNKLLPFIFGHFFGGKKRTDPFIIGRGPTLHIMLKGNLKRGDVIPSLKLTNRPWKWMIGRRLPSLLGQKAYSQRRFVLGSVVMSHDWTDYKNQMSHEKAKLLLSIILVV